MAVRRILQLGDPLLRSVSLPVSDLAAATPTLADLADTLADFRRTHGFGRGISAIQIGVPLRIIHLEVEGVRYQLLNPEFTFRSADTFEMWDDCFSFPGLLVRLRRSNFIRLTYAAPSGQPHHLEASGGLAELIQHEMDHLDGILAIDRAIDRDSLATRDEWKRRFAL